jgi:MoaD family protein
MKVTVKYFAMIRELTHRREDSLELGEGASIQTVLSRLCDIYGEDFRLNICAKDGSLKNGVILLLNGEAVNRGNLKSRKVKDGDIAAIMPPVGGG